MAGHYDLGGIKPIDAEVTYRIPSDYATLSDAVQDISQRNIAANSGVDLVIESGHELASGLKLEGGDYSKITIKSEDATVFLDPAFSGDLFTMTNCKAPNWGIVADAQGKSVALNVDGNYGAGLYYGYNSQGYILNNCGVKNVGNTNNDGVQCFVGWDSKAICQSNGVFSGAGYINVWVTHLSFGYFGSADMSGATDRRNLFISRGSICYCSSAIIADSLDSGVHIYRSKLVAPGGLTISNCANEAVLCQAGSDFIAHQRSGSILSISNCGSGVLVQRASRADIWQVDFSGMSGSSIVAEGGSNIFARLVTADNVADTFIVAEGAGSSVDAPLANVTNNSGRSLFASQGAIINVQGSNFNNGLGNAVAASDGAVVNAKDCEVSGTFETGYIAIRGSTINMDGSTGIGATINGVKATEGSTINASGANVRKGGSDDPSDIVVEKGSTITANGSTGGLSQTANTITSDGIIFK